MVAALAAGCASAAGATGLLPACAYGTQVKGLVGFEQNAITQAADAYDGDRQTFAAAAAAYVYGFPLEDLFATVKGYVRNTLVNVDALATPSTKNVVSPNVDTAYSVSWIDLSQGPIVFSVPAMPDRYYTIQFMDAYTNAFAYVGWGSTGKVAGDYALVPPGWSGTLPAGVTKIQAPTNTLWLLGRTLTSGTAADLAQVKTAQAGYHLTPLALWEAGVRSPAVSLSSYPAGKTRSIPAGSGFIATLNQELQINPPPAADDCLLSALAPAGVRYSTPSAAQTQAADAENIAGVTPPLKDDPAVDAGLAEGKLLVDVALNDEDSTLSKAAHGWEILTSDIGTYGQAYLPRAMIATDFLGANIPSQGMYPLDSVDVDGKALNGADDYTISFPKGELPPAGAFWSLTLYGPDDYLYANQINRYAIGNRTSGLHYGADGSLTLYIQHAEPAGAAQQANWLPAPSGDFHVVLRLYEPAKSALDGAWTPPPIFAPGETLTPVLSRLRRSGRTLRWNDSQAARVTVTLRGPGGRTLARVHVDHAGANTLKLGVALRMQGRYRVTLQAARALYDTGASRRVSLAFRIR